MKNHRIIVSTFMLILLISGCTSMRPISNSDSPKDILENVSPGDLIHVETLDGSKYEIIVKSVGINSLKDDQVEIPLDQIKSLKKEKISVLKTTGAVIGGIYAYSLLAVLVLILSL